MVKNMDKNYKLLIPKYLILGRTVICIPLIIFKILNLNIAFLIGVLLIILTDIVGNYLSNIWKTISKKTNLLNLIARKLFLLILIGCFMLEYHISPVFAIRKTAVKRSFLLLNLGCRRLFAQLFYILSQRLMVKNQCQQEAQRRNDHIYRHDHPEPWPVFFLTGKLPYRHRFEKIRCEQSKEIADSIVCAGAPYIRSVFIANAKEIVSVPQRYKPQL